MHAFADLVDRCTAFTFKALNEAQERTVHALQESAATGLVKTLQMIQLQRAISAIGMFSIFEAILQNQLECSDGFRHAAKILDREGETALKGRFEDLQLATNVLKHGRGRSYEALVERAETLDFRLKQPGEHSFSEGDVSEVSTLIEVDDAFVLSCAKVIHEVSEVMRRSA